LIDLSVTSCTLRYATRIHLHNAVPVFSENVFWDVKTIYFCCYRARHDSSKLTSSRRSSLEDKPRDASTSVAHAEL